MAYMTAASLNLSQAPPRAGEPGNIRFAVELSSIPRLNRNQQRVGFGGFKNEDLNKSPVFGRARVGVSLPWDLTLELAWTPPLEINDARPEGLWGAALSRPLFSLNNWHLGLRAYTVRGEVTAPVTCSADVVAQAPGTFENPFSCIALSNDRLTLDHYGAELVFSWWDGRRRWQPYLATAITRMDPFTEINALLLNVIEFSTIDSQGSTTSFSAGVNYQLTEEWGISIASSYTPLDVERPPGNPGGQDNFWTLRVGLNWDL